MVAYSVSVDGGRTFIDRGNPPVLQSAHFGDAGDPVLAVDDVSKVFYLVGTSERNEEGDAGVPFWSASDRGANFVRRPTVLSTVEDSDYPWVAVDKWSGVGQHDVYIIIWRIVPSPQYITVSTDGNGGGWSNAVTLGDDHAYMPQIAVSPNHVLHVVWTQTQPRSLMHRAFADRLRSPSSPSTIVPLDANWETGELWTRLYRQDNPQAGDWFKAFNNPALAVSPVRADQLYVAYADKGTAANDRSDVFVIRSTDGGDNWIEKQRVHLDATSTDQWMPVIAMKPDGSQIFVAWNDRRTDPYNSLTSLRGRFGTIAADGNITFGSEFRISTDYWVPAFPGTLASNKSNGHYDPVWPPEGVNLHWWYDWWPEPDLSVVPNDYHYTDWLCANHYSEHNGAYANDDAIYVAWVDDRRDSMGTQYAGRKQSDIRLARLTWPQ